MINRPSVPSFAKRSSTGRRCFRDGILTSRQLLPALAATLLVSQPGARAADAAPVPTTKITTVSIVLAPRNTNQLTDLVKRLYDPSDPLYGKYLTPAEYAAQFGPTTDQVAAVSSFAQTTGLSVVSVSDNNAIVKLQGSVAQVEAAFHVALHEASTPDGQEAMAPDTAPTLPASLAGQVTAVVGLDTTGRARRDAHATPVDPDIDIPNVQHGTGVGGALAPKDFKSIYAMTNAAGTGSGETAAIIAFDGWTPADITKEESEYSLPSVVPQLVSVDGGTGVPTTNPDETDSIETTLDIDMMLFAAPNIASILMYQVPPGGNYYTQILDLLNKIASDDKAHIISISYGSPEEDLIKSGGFSELIAENQALVQMAVQGQTVCAAAGDEGAYADETITTPNVNDLAAQPNVLTVGGTDLTDSSSEDYVSETSWADTSDKSYGQIGTGGGGGISQYWAQPAWQLGAVNTAVDTQGSTTMRNLPDVSLYADFDDPGYSISYTNPTTTDTQAWYSVNGTSAAAPLWAGFLADVDQLRQSTGRPPIGLADPAIYTLANNATSYAKDFHDIADGSNNLYYKAVKGYDNSTGWGSFQGNNLMSDLAGLGAPVVDVHVLWDNLSGAASIWNYNPTNGQFTSMNYGAFNGWTAADIADGPDGLTHVLWRTTTGSASIWALNNSAGTYTQSTFGPYAGFTASSISVGPDDTVHVLWNETSGAASIWNYSTPTGQFTQHTYGAFPGWTAQAIADGPDGVTRVLWVNASETLSLWFLNSTEGTYTEFTYGPFPEWTPTAVSVGADNTTHVLWTDGSQYSVWSVNSTTGAWTQASGGPFPGWAATAIANGPTGSTPVIFDNTSGATAIWDLNDLTGTFSQFSFGPFAGWTATALTSAE
ncbi:MAG: protease pro-enzyme activation domain-containing protein [Capsulimonadaceae bacterium]